MSVLWAAADALLVDDQTALTSTFYFLPSSPVVQPLPSD